MAIIDGAVPPVSHGTDFLRWHVAMSNETIPVRFPDPFTVKPFGSSAEVQFVDTRELSSWCANEVAAWEGLRSVASSDLGILSKLSQRLLSFYEGLKNNAANIEVEAADGIFAGKPQAIQGLSRISSALQHIATGAMASTSSRGSAQALSVLPNNPTGAAAILLLYSSEYQQQFRGKIPGDANLLDILRSLLESGRPSGDEQARATFEHAFGDLRNRAQQELRDVQSFLAQEKGASEKHWIERSAAASERDKKWLDELGGIKQQWGELRKIYDETLALSAPTTYWSAKQVRHRGMSIRYAVAFALMVTAGMIAFCVWGLPVLSAASEMSAGGGAYVPRLLEIAIPAFLAIWVLRIVGRLLSTHLELMEDAGERATMVKTFLALMHDQASGKAMVQDQDRILILSALFRPSVSKGVDDAPPASWFDVLMTRIKKD